MNTIPATDWLFDLGNTRLKCAPLVADHGGDVHALAHGDADFAERLDALLPTRGGVAHVASVVSTERTVDLLELLASRFTRIDIARTQARCAGVRIAYAEPARLGVDRFLALLAAHARGAGPALVVGVGTALTLDLIDAGGQHPVRAPVLRQVCGKRDTGAARDATGLRVDHHGLHALRAAVQTQIICHH